MPPQNPLQSEIFNQNMSGNTFGKLFTVTTYGESHGSAIGGFSDLSLILYKPDIFNFDHEVLNELKTFLRMFN
jgi:hypothetical protein